MYVFLSNSQTKLMFFFYFIFLGQILTPICVKIIRLDQISYFDFYEYVSSKWAFCVRLIYTFHHVTRQSPSFKDPNIYIL